MKFLRTTAQGVLVDLHVQPGAKRSRIIGPHGDRLRVAVKAPPTDGKANEELEELLAKECRVARRSVSVISGGASRRKTLLLGGAVEGEIAARLEEIIPHG